MEDDIGLVEELLGGGPLEAVVRDDEVVRATGLTILVHDTWIPTDIRIWRAWTGRRALWGQEYHGPVFLIDSRVDRQWGGKRTCTCPTCQSTVPAELRPN
jgi:hypothetical protein